ncbi:hypothetical protein [Natronobacterium gregoryi]|uniref:Uncharacterized protein n=2 Tax=Natronobacterium gregoryi TaxID=44930 RepID=L0AJ45_NATGS|nr:hypothetical protein [Natronobacterium gregoryi]AFZ73469.1 hypothetical protein Natgr_2293 [Natronobacterium gregoryi SP2]ELY68323.1 hypothetical protein C490_09623 [Natronobacterium gregoryi SP2]PLK20515.1 hypothetical protein CYV19_09310 [Natronobacterium gregoryi SP2]SFI71237.1 hypothetical protein SAMN05443661_10433 [Natronobacterium gregoryi]
MATSERSVFDRYRLTEYGSLLGVIVAFAVLAQFWAIRPAFTLAGCLLIVALYVVGRIIRALERIADSLERLADE